MKIIIRSAKIIDAASPFHNQVADLLISDGLLQEIAPSILAPENAKEIKIEDLHISNGWFDSSVSFGEPGFEDRETIANGLTVAAKSGFTGVALQPNSYPIIDNQAQINFVKSKAAGFATSLYPIGAFTKGSEGKDMAELFDMKNAGAIAFGDYNKSIENANLLKIGLQYTQDFDGLVIAFSKDANISGSGVANEGIVSTKLGLKGIPSLAEELQVARNLFLLEYTGGRLHIPTISTAKSVALIRDAKAKGLKVTCSVAVHNLVLNDSKLEEFDTRFKVIPPLRNENDRKALIEAVVDGTVDTITSDHNPIDIEYKKMDFDTAKYGTIGLESAFTTLLAILPLEVIVQKLTYGRNVFGIEIPVIKAGAAANLTLFTTKEVGKFTKDAIESKSKNAALLDAPTKGTVCGVFNNNQLIVSK